MRKITKIIKKIVKLEILNYLYNYSTLLFQGVIYDKSLKINGKLYCACNQKGNIVIGRDVKINSSLQSNPIGGETRTILFTKDLGEIIIGDNTGMSNVAIVAQRSISIGNNVYIGGNTKIYDTDFHSVSFKERGTSGENIISLPVTIGDNVFIGAHSIILKGVIIGDGAVVGAGSVVTKSISQNEIWAGNPAKFIRRINE